MKYRFLVAALIAAFPIAALADTADADRPLTAKVRRANPEDSGWRERLALQNDRHDTAYVRPAVHRTQRPDTKRRGQGVPLASKPFHRPSVILPGPVLGL